MKERKKNLLYFYLTLKVDKIEINFRKKKIFSDSYFLKNSLHPYLFLFFFHLPSISIFPLRSVPPNPLSTFFFVFSAKKLSRTKIQHLSLGLSKRSKFC